MTILHFAALAVTVGLVSVTLKSINKEAALACLVAGGVILSFAALEILTDVFGLFYGLGEEYGVNDGIIKIVLKVIAICCVTEFSAGLLTDFDMKGLSQKLTVIGKIIALTATYPVVEKFLEMIKLLA